MLFPKHLLAYSVVTLMFAVGCGGGSSSSPPQAPVFTSTAPTTASQGVAYGYAITATDPAGGAVTFALSTAPTGAALSGGTLSWTPAAAQSRTANSFTVTATTSEGGTARQSWSVTPSGTINGSWINTRWTASGSAKVPLDWTKIPARPPQALVPQPDGTFVTVVGTGNSDGTFTIPAIPGGYYWLQIGRAFWTSSSNFDYGFDENGRSIGTTAAGETTTFDFNISGLDPVVSGDQFAFLTDWATFSSVMNIGFGIPSSAGSTTMTASYVHHSNLDYSTADMGFLLQYEPVSAGSVTGVALGPELMVPNLSLTSGTTNTVAATLNASPQKSFDLSVKGSQWAPLFDNAGPSVVKPVDAYISMSARPFEPAGVFGGSLNLPLFLPPLTMSGCCLFTFGWPSAATCGDGVGIIQNLGIITSYPPMLTDQDFGTLSYGDPFDSSWGRVFSLCQTASIDIPAPGGGTSTFLFQDGVNTAIPSTPVSPLALPVQNPTINGASLFSTNTVNPSAVMLSWSAPSSGTTPSAYKATLFRWGTLPDGTMTYLNSGEFYTGKTSMTLPALQPSSTYVIVLTTEVDARANVETSPNRSALPTAVASVISAPITTGAGT